MLARETSGLKTGSSSLMIPPVPAWTSTEALCATLEDMDPCPHCGESGCDSECLLIMTGLPGADRRAWLREHPDEQNAERE